MMEKSLQIHFYNGNSKNITNDIFMQLTRIDWHNSKNYIFKNIFSYCWYIISNRCKSKN